MKTFIVIILILSSGLARAQSSSVEKLFNTTSYVPYLAALECPGVGSLQLKELYEWRRGGAQIDNAGDSLSRTINQLKARAKRIDSFSEFLIFESQTDLENSKTELVMKQGGFDPRSLGLAPTLYGCVVHPISIDASELRDGKPYLVVKSVYDRLAPLDQYIFKLLLKGVRPEVLRTLVDARSLRGSLGDRYRRFYAAGLPSFETGDVTLALLPPTSSSVVFEGADLKEARAIYGEQYNVNYGMRATFTSDGHLHSILNIYARGMLRRAPTPNQGIFYPDHGGLDCRNAAYRADRTMINCNGTFYSSGGAEIASVDRTWYLRSQVDHLASEDFVDDRNGVYAQNFVIEDSYGEARTMKVTNSLKDIASLTVVAGEPSCSGLKQTSHANGNAFDIEFTVPANCVALVHIDWRGGAEMKPPTNAEPSCRCNTKKHR